MKLLLLGATGPTGTHALHRALDAGDTVTALVRRPDALTDVADRVRVLAGDATRADDLTAAMAGQDAVVAALGRGTSVRAGGFFTAAADATTTAAHRAGLRRLVWLSSFGVRDTYADANPLQKVMYRTFLRDIYADKAASEKILRATGLDLTIVYPSALTNGPATGTYRVGDHVPMPLIARISRADVGAFLHAAVHSPAWSARDAVLTG